MATDRLSDFKLGTGDADELKWIGTARRGAAWSCNAFAIATFSSLVIFCLIKMVENFPFCEYTCVINGSTLYVQMNKHNISAVYIDWKCEKQAIKLKIVEENEMNDDMMRLHNTVAVSAVTSVMWDVIRVASYFALNESASALSQCYFSFDFSSSVVCEK